ncbi:hypothetical protein D3C87_1334670 [compost metagenome]
MIQNTPLEQSCLFQIFSKDLSGKDRFGKDPYSKISTAQQAEKDSLEVLAWSSSFQFVNKFESKSEIGRVSLEASPLLGRCH